MGTIGTEVLSVQIGVFMHKRQHTGMTFWLYSAVVRGPSGPVALTYWYGIWQSDIILSHGMGPDPFVSYLSDGYMGVRSYS